MKICFRAVLPVSAILVSALLLTGPLARAQDAVSDGKSVIKETVTVTENGNTTDVTIEEQVTPAESGNFQGLVPPVGTSPKVSYGAPRSDGDDTHPPMRLTPDKSEIVRLEENAVSIIVGNPDHLGVLMDDARLLILVPRQPGATYLTVLNKDGQVIMQRHVIVSVANRDYIRIRRSCGSAGSQTGGASACQETSVYYCKGMCHEVGLVENNGDTTVPPPITARTSTSSENNVVLENAPPAETPVSAPAAEPEPQEEEPEPEPDTAPEE